jgi:hypothetical protein
MRAFVLPYRPALLCVALFGLGACSSAYQPRPSPRIAVVQEGGRPMLVKNDRRYDIGAFGGGLVDAVEGHRAAEQYAESFRTRTVAGFTMNVGGLVLSIGGVGLLGAGLGGRDSFSEPLPIMGASLTIAGLGLALAGAFVQASAPAYFWDAINAYNDAVPSGWPVPPPGFSPMPPPAMYPLPPPAPAPAPAPPP